MKQEIHRDILNTKNLICFWDFREREGEKRISLGNEHYALLEGGEPIERSNEGVFGTYSADIKEGQWFYIPRDNCPKLNIHGRDAQVTIVAWVKRKLKSFDMCEAVAGIWNETDWKRQYCLFLNLSIWNSSQQVCGHISGTGAPTEGYKYCMDASIGNTAVSYDQWHCIAITYDGVEAKSYLNGILDRRVDRNPYSYAKGIFDGGDDGGDFTVGAVYRSGEMGNFFVGKLGGLAVFDRALSEKEISQINPLVHK